MNINDYLKEDISFSSFKGNELLEFLNVLLDYTLKYRVTLGLDENLTFGLEIEEEGIAHSVVKEYLKKNLNWTVEVDGSLGMISSEIKTPIFTDSIATHTDILNIYTFLDKNGMEDFGSAGGHIHYGANILNHDYRRLRKLLKCFASYENVFYRFGYGDKLCARLKIATYALPIRFIILNNLKEINNARTISSLLNALGSYSKEKRHSLRIECMDLESDDLNNTFEFREPNPTRHAVIAQNNINAHGKLILASINAHFDEEKIDFRLKKIEQIANPKITYNEVMLKDALELVDLIFTNNLDKIYFLRQYIKDFEVASIHKTQVLAPKFY